MKFKVFRKGQFLTDIETSRQDEFQFAPVENVLLMKGDILESYDGARLEVIAYNPAGKIRAGISFKLLED